VQLATEHDDAGLCIDVDPTLWYLRVSEQFTLHTLRESGVIRDRPVLRLKVLDLLSHPVGLSDDDSRSTPEHAPHRSEHTKHSVAQHGPPSATLIRVDQVHHHRAECTGAEPSGWREQPYSHERGSSSAG